MLVIASWYPTERSAGGSFVQDQVRALAAEHDVAVIAPQLRKFRSLARGAWFAGRAPRLEDGIPVVRPVIVPPLPRAKDLVLRLYARGVRSAMRSLGAEWQRPDIIHAHVVLPGGWAAARIGAELEIPVVLTEHSGPFSMHLQSRIDRSSTRWTLANVARVLAVGPGLAGEIEEFAPTTPVRVLGNVIDTDFFTPAVDGADDKPVGRALRVVTVSALTAGKGIDTLLRAVAELRASDAVRPPLLAIVGDGPARPELERLAMRLGVSGVCCFVGAQGRGQVRDWLRWADLFVLPSHAETFSVATAEAMACATPVVVTRSGGPDRFVTPDSSLVVEPDDPAGLASALQMVLRSEALLDGAAARRVIVDRFSRAAFLAAMRTTYLDVIDRDGASGQR